ncbi:phage distal tail protein [Dietzia natronolimnaea]|uniref:phage distal tail protein n=1 Tax=Dietzia natronolimnaea TaxID=161920 RepID=UPI0015F8A140|nr:phage tail domain-containing protein [Dietzia natronolimnaea]MBB1037406.1 phage tail family protein [Dietzia natronolimnaea]
MIGIRYGQFNLQDPQRGIWVTSTDVYSSPESSIQADTLTQADGALVVQQRYRSKNYSIEGVIRRATVPQLEQAIDEFKMAMAVRNQAFDIDYAGGVRRYLSYANTVTISRNAHGTSARFVVSFLCPDGVGWDVNSSALLEPTGITASGATSPIHVGGTYKAQPTISVTINTITGGTDRVITISNGTTLRGISVQRDWVAGDILEIDSLKMTVFVNNVAVDFTGQFPQWEAGPSSISYLDGFVARDVTLQVAYTRRWL